MFNRAKLSNHSCDMVERRYDFILLYKQGELCSLASIEAVKVPNVNCVLKWMKVNTMTQINSKPSSLGLFSFAQKSSRVACFILSYMYFSWNSFSLFLKVCAGSL